MNIRIRPVVITQCFSDLPVPVGAKTISQRKRYWKTGTTCWEPMCCKDKI